MVMEEGIRLDYARWLDALVLKPETRLMSYVSKKSHPANFPRLRIVLALAPLLVGGMSNLVADDIESKRPLEHEDYAKWNTLSNQNISNDGKWISYVVSPGDGDSTLMIREVDTAREYSVVRGTNARFSFDSQFVLFTVEPDPEIIKELRKEKKAESEIPREQLEILHLATGQQTTIENVRRFSLPEKGTGWTAFMLIEEDRVNAIEESKSALVETYEITPEGVRRLRSATSQAKSETTATSEEKKASKQKGQAEVAESTSEEKPEAKKEKKEKKEKKLGGTLVLRNLTTQLEQRFPHVINHRFDEVGETLAFATSADDGEDDGVFVVDLKKLTTQQIVSGRGNYGQVVFSQDGRQVAFLTDRDEYEAEEPEWSIYLWKRGRTEAQEIVNSRTEGIPAGWEIAPTAAPLFTEDERRLLFRTRPKQEADQEEDKQADPVAKLDLWHWQDPFLQPQQLLNAERERNRSYEAVFDLRTRQTNQLATREISSVEFDPRNTADLVIGTAPDQYNKMRSWDMQAYSDWYLISLRTGESTKLAEMKRGTPSLSPAGKYITWWDGEQATWYALPAQTPKSGADLPKPIDLGDGIGFPLQDELHDTPSLPGPYGTAGWLANDEGLLLYDRWDIWLVDPAGEKKPRCLTHGRGREGEIQFRLVRLDAEARTIDLEEPQILSVLVHETKASGYYRMTTSTGQEQVELHPLIVFDERISGLRKAKAADAVMFTRSTFERCPDIWASTLDFQQARRISHINPQQDEFLWGTAELVHWNAEDGQALDGLLYKPEGFDPEKKYPLMVYFYERNSDNLHTYYTPAAGRSIINFSFYVSRGYVIFVPDIPYEVGEPGPSAANAVLPGVKHIVDLGFIDEQRIGMQGHSWGGYQTAYLVTVTDMFACAESGAPVSNMTSAYGGIRWGTGLSRMFQYEKTQSRIGGTLWESREKYIANSPLFFADKINTPLLILHNDEDTAVPWYQGIELFVALRRLEKPAWMLNYNGEPHWVMKDENRLDFAKRMQQFFDHYLKGDPMPVWMADGIPAVDKGKKFGFEPAEAAPTSNE